MSPVWKAFAFGVFCGLWIMPVLWFVARFVIDMLVARSRTAEAIDAAWQRAEAEQRRMQGGRHLRAM